jgi:hypothetical protein
MYVCYCVIRRFHMVSPRIWVSCAAGENAQQGMSLAQRLISDLRDAGAEVVSESATLPDEQFLSFLQQELERCQWFILVQTPQGMGSRRTQLAIQEALSRFSGGSLRGVCLVNVSPDGWDEPAPWPEMRSYTYNGDYPRLRDKLLLDLDLLQITGLLEEEQIDTMIGMPPSLQGTPGFHEQTTDGDGLRPFQERRGEIYQSSSPFQMSSPSGSLRLLGNTAPQHSPTPGDRPAPLRFTLPRPSRRFWLYSLVSVCVAMLIISGAVLAKDMASTPSPVASSTPITLMRPSSTHATPTRPVPTHTAPTQSAPTQPAPGSASSSPAPVASQKAGWVFITTSTLPVLNQAGNPESARCSSQGGTATVPDGYNVVAVDNNAYQIGGQTYLHVAYPDPCEPGLDYSTNSAIANGTGAVGWVAEDALVPTHVVRPQPQTKNGADWRDCWAPNTCGDAPYPNTTATLPAKDAELYAWWTGSYWDVHWWHVLDTSGKQASVYGRDWGAFPQ